MSSTRRDKSSARWPSLALAFLLCVLVTVVFAQQTTFQYFYDDLGRLVKVVDSAGNVVTYTYDASGNIVSITRSTLSSPTALAILNFTPQEGPVGTTVTIQGQAFDPTAANDTVKFNGTVAAVSSATATTLIATVPNGATTGPISVTVGGATAQSSTNFTVTAPAPSPVSITISPALASTPAATQFQFSATGTFSGGSTQDITQSVVWASSNSAVAAIASQVGNGSGVATGITPGTFTITASSGSVTGNASLKVLAGGTVKLVVSPPTASIVQGTAAQFTATATLSTGGTQDVTAAVAWSSSNPTVATISNAAGTEGQAQALTPGTTTITATSGGLSSSATLTVTPPSGGTGTIPRFAFAEAQGPGGVSGIYSYTMDPTTAQLRLASYLNVSNFGPMVNGTPVAVDPTGKFAYATVSQPQNCGSGCASDAIVGFLISSDGALVPVPGDPFPCECFNFSTLGFSQITFDPLGHFLYVPGQTLNTAGVNAITAFTINRTTGALTPIPGSPFPAGLNPIATAVDPSGKFLYAVNFDNNGTVSAFSINSTTGALTPVPGSPFPFPFPPTSPRPQYLAIDPTVPLVYVANGQPGLAGGTQIVAYSMNTTTGALTALGTPTSLSQGIGSMLIDPSGKFLYVAAFSCDTFGDSTCGFSINASTGALTPFSSATNIFDTGPLQEFDPSGKFLVVADGKNYQPLSFNSSTGALTPLREQALETGAPTAIAAGSSSVVHVPKFAYVANSGDNNVSAYSINPATGALTAITGSPFAAGTAPSAAFADPSGRFLYLANSGSNNVSAYNIDAATGALTPITGSPFPAGTGPSGMTTDPTGRFLFVANQGSNNLSEYSIDPNSGVLTAITGSPYAVGTAPSGVLSWAFPQAGNGVLAINSGSNNFTLFGMRGAPPGDLVTPTTKPGAPGATTPVSGIVDPTFFTAGESSFACSLCMGPFLVVANSGSNNVTVYGFAFTAVLNPIFNTSLAAGTSPQSVAIEPTDNFIYVAGGPATGPGSVSAFSMSDLLFGSGTMLIPVSGSPFAAGRNPLSVTVDPSGQFAYVVNSGDSTVSVYTINPSTGALAPISGSPSSTGASPKSLTIVGTIR